MIVFSRFSIILLIFVALFQQAFAKQDMELFAKESGNVPNYNASNQSSKAITETLVRTPTFAGTSVLASGDILPYGYNLFTANSIKTDRTGVSPDYVLASGDRVNVNIWGAVSNESIITVDARGNIFIPEVGPVRVAGTRASDLNNIIQSEIRRVYQDNVEVYVNLADRVPVSLFVSGSVNAPGRYAGNPGDSLIDYITKAGGIDLERGSFRHIDIMRNGRRIETYDLYEFLRSGALPKTSLREGDVLVVAERGDVVNVTGAAHQAFAFELKKNSVYGKDIAYYARPTADATHVTVSGMRDSVPFGQYMTIAEFANFTPADGDQVIFEQGAHNNSVKIKISGAHLGSKIMVVPLETRLKEVLENTPINPKLARNDAIYIKRVSVAQKQKQSLRDSVKRLQETLLLARASGNSKASPVGEGEIKMLESFMAKTEGLQPEGRVVVAGRKDISDMALEEGDEIVIPNYSDLVTINGEVILPKAIIWNEDDSVSDYIERAGGFTDNANEDDIIVMRANGEAELGHDVKIMPGDEIIIMPEVKINNLELAASVADILYKSVLAVAIPMRMN